MLSAHLEDRFRDALGEGATEARSDSIRFAVEFTRMLARVVPEQITDSDLGAMRAALEVRAELSQAEIDLLLSMALAPEHRADVGEDELRAFGSRFGRAEEEALRMAVAEELDLHAFSEKYGPAEALLLLDSLFGVCAVDGQIDGGEISRLQRAASELGVDPMLVGALFRKHDVRHANGDFAFDLTERTEWIIGRSTGADIQLPDPQVALRHARLVKVEDGWRVVDLGSGRPTLLQGSPVSSGPLLPGEDLRVGPYRLTLDHAGTTLAVFGSTSFSSLSVIDLHRVIPTSQGDLVLLDGVEFTVFSGEVIALVGPSGAGKTTLLSAIAGIAKPDSGDVLLDRNDFHTLLESDRSLVGNVPQEDVVHGELTVEESLRYAARLRFPRDVGRDTIEGEVDRVLSELDITHIRKSRIGSPLRRGISGGQRKRVNLGQELLTRTTRVLFLDEPTSGLDPQTAQDIVSQVRQLADDGRIVFIVTHDVSPAIMAMVDHLMVLAKGGRLAWFGPPEEASDWFGVRSADEIFARLPDRTPEEWRDRYRESRAFRKYVRTREHLLGLDGVTQKEAERGRTKRSFTKQYTTLTRRYAQVKLRDWTGTGVLVAQAPILAVAMWIVFPHADTATMFVLVLSALWFGASASVRELISERAIWRREARGGLMLLPYMLSKVTVLGALVTLQCVLLAGIVWGSLGMWEYDYDLLALCGVTVGTGIVGMAMGLLVSAIFSSSEAAVGTLPLLLIPQITFGGLIVTLKNMKEAASDLPWYVAHTMIVRYSFEAAIKTGDKLSKPGHKGVGESAEGIQRWLFDLGFRSSGADDMGLSMWVLSAILAGFFVVFMSITTVLVHRSRRGN